MAYATVEGDMAFRDKDYETEKMYNESVRNHNENQSKASRELTQVKQLLEQVHQEYIKAVESLGTRELRNAAITLSVKRLDTQRMIEELSQRRKWAVSKGDIAYREGNFDEEQEYNRIASDCFIESTKTEPKLHYYEAFIKDIDGYAHNKGEQDVSSPDI